MKLTRNLCDCCDYYAESTKELINKLGPNIEPNQIYMCEKCKKKFQDRKKWGLWLDAVKSLLRSTQS